MPADDAHALLTQLHGIGPWTADLYLLACLGHADAWPAGDLALQEAARLAFGLDKRPTTRDMGPLAEGWRPYRAVAARLLWAYYRVAKSREGVLVEVAPAGKPQAAKKRGKQWRVRSTVRALRRRADPRASWSCSCMAMAPTATT